MEINDIIIARITGVQSYGLFTEYQGYYGLVHISEISDFYVGNIDCLFSVGDLIEVSVLSIDKSKQQLQLSYKKAIKIHPRILTQIPIVSGFHPLFNKLDFWIKEKKIGD